MGHAAQRIKLDLPMPLLQDYAIPERQALFLVPAHGNGHAKVMVAVSRLHVSLSRWFMQRAVPRMV